MYYCKLIFLIDPLIIIFILSKILFYIFMIFFMFIFIYNIDKMNVIIYILNIFDIKWNLEYILFQKTV